jgi:catechol 2,3-dioxygenase-like lactoylglutathione lyase family enzyme
LSPFFIVEDYATSVAYYRDVLGFAVEYEAPEDESPFFGIVARDGSSLFLKEILPEVAPTPNHTRHEWAPWDAYLDTPDPDTLYSEFVGRGAAFQKPLHDDEDNFLRGFEILDPNGYVLFFGRLI